MSHEIVNPFIASVESSNRSMNMFVEHLNVRIVGSHEDVKIGKIATESGRYGPIIDNCFVRDELENQGTYADAIDGVGWLLVGDLLSNFRRDRLHDDFHQHLIVLRLAIICCDPGSIMGLDVFRSDTTVLDKKVHIDSRGVWNGNNVAISSRPSKIGSTLIDIVLEDMNILDGTVKNDRERKDGFFVNNFDFFGRIV